MHRAFDGQSLSDVATCTPVGALHLNWFGVPMWVLVGGAWLVDPRSTSQKVLPSQHVVAFDSPALSEAGS